MFYQLLILVKISFIPYSYSHPSPADFIVFGEKIDADLLDHHGSAHRLDKEELHEAGINDLREVAEITPNFHIVGPSSGRYSTPFIRGLGNQDLNLPDEVAVTFYLDEVPLPRYAFDIDLVDLKKIEVLKGAQGTLFGKNTQAGAVLMTSKDPTENKTSSFSLGLGNLGQKKAETVLNYSHSSFYGSTSLKISERDGWIPDRVLGQDLGEKRQQSLKQSFSYRPHDKRRWTFRLGGQREDGADTYFIARDHPHYPLSAQNLLPDYRRDLLTSSLKLEEQVTGKTEMIFTSAFNYYDFKTRYDEADELMARDHLLARGLPPHLTDSLLADPNRLYRDVKEYERIKFNELRFRREHLSYLTLSSGINYLETNYDLIFFVDTFSAFGPTEIEQDIKLRGQNLSLFGQIDYQASSKWNFQLGLRGNYDRKIYESKHTSTMPALPFYQQESSENYQDITGKISSMYFWSTGQRTYASFSRGYQPGGYPSFQFNNYSARPLDQLPYGKSVSWSYELGHKVRAMNERLHLSSSLFLNDVKNKQVRVREPVSGLNFYENIDAQIFGGELSSTYFFSSPWMVGGNLGYTNSRFRETVLSAEDIVLEKNNRLANIPYWSGASFIQYADFLSVISGIFSARISYSYIGSRPGENTNQTRLSSYGLWNSRLSYQRDHLELSFVVKNIFDKLYESQAFYFESLNTEVSSPGLPRLFTFELKWIF